MDGIARSLHQALINDKKKLLKIIAHDYDLNEDELIQRYMETENHDIPATKKFTKKKRNDCIETEEYTYNGIVYLIDSKDQVYTYNIEKPMLIGDKLLDGTIKFLPEYIRMIRECSSSNN